MSPFDQKVASLEFIFFLQNFEASPKSTPKGALTIASEFAPATFYSALWPILQGTSNALFGQYAYHLFLGMVSIQVSPAETG